MRLYIAFISLAVFILLEQGNNAATNNQPLYSANGLYSVMINSPSSISSGPIINISSGQVFRIIYNAESGIPGCGNNCGILVNNAYCTNIFIPAVWGSYYGSPIYNYAYQSCTLAGPCKITFTNGTGFSLLQTFQISANPSTSQTDY